MDHIHVGLIDFIVVTGYVIIAHYLARVAAYSLRRSGHEAASGAIGSLL